MKRVTAFLLVAAACTAPGYTFLAADSGGPDIQGRDSGPITTDDDDAVVIIPPQDAASDAPLSSNAPPLPTTAMPDTGNIDADCTNFVGDMGAAVLEDANIKKHCVMFFHSASWKRTWDEALTMCTTITRGTKHAHLAVFPDKKKGDAVVALTSVFPPTLAAWIGLQVTADPPTSKTNWAWITGESAQDYDGWSDMHPIDGGVLRTCASWAGEGASGATWTNVECGTLKGTLCEMDEQ